MKTTTIAIYDSLKNDGILDSLERYKGHDGYFVGDNNVLDVTENYKSVRNILLNSIENGTYDFLPYSRRSAIIDSYNNTNTQYASLNNFLVYIDTFCDIVLTSGLPASQIGKNDYEAEMRKVISYRDNIEQFNNYINEKQVHLDELNNYYLDIVQKSSEVDGHVKSINTGKDYAGRIVSEIETTRDLSISKLTEIKEIEDDIESKRLPINTFFKNIDDYKERISDTDAIVANIISKENTINELINSAETALSLKSAQGISAAFAAQYVLANKNKGAWLIGAGIFLSLSLAATAWILTGYGIKNPNEIASILGRIVAVGITIAGATFCASQYQKQISIAEDYAYKAVLSKSILAFSDEIKKRNDTQVTDYLTKVLTEIHKDPQRSRSTKNNLTNKFNTNSLVEKLLDKIPSPKE